MMMMMMLLLPTTTTTTFSDDDNDDETAAPQEKDRCRFAFLRTHLFWRGALAAGAAGAARGATARLHSSAGGHVNLRAICLLRGIVGVLRRAWWNDEGGNGRGS